MLNKCLEIKELCLKFLIDPLRVGWGGGGGGIGGEGLLHKLPFIVTLQIRNSKLACEQTAWLEETKRNWPRVKWRSELLRVPFKLKVI